LLSERWSATIHNMGIDKVTVQSSENIIKKMHRVAENLPDQEEVRASLERLKKPFIQIDYKEADSVRGEYEGMQYILDYEMADSGSIQSLEDYFQMEPEVAKDPQAGTVSNWRRVNKMQFISGGVTYDTLKLFPRNYDIFFCPNGKEGEYSQASLLDSKNIFIIGGVNTPESIAFILHEIGHIWDNLKLKVMGKDRMVDDHQHALLAEKLRTERMANAFALKLLKPFIKDNEQRKDFLNLLKNYALLSYHLEVKDEVDAIENSQKLFSHFAQDFDMGEEYLSEVSWSEPEDE
jgi:hypothetical protein